MKFSDFVFPASVEEAVGLLDRHAGNAVPVAGATAFQYISDRDNLTAVDISRLGLKGIDKKKSGFVIGANTTLTDLVRYKAPGWVLDQIATRIPTHQIRNISTIAGNICRLFPWSEIPLGLMVLEGKITGISPKGEVSWSADEFFKAQPRNVLKGNTVVTSIEVPSVGKGQGFGYRKENITNSAFGLMTAAVLLEIGGGKITRIRVAAGSGLPVPTFMPTVEKALTGVKASADAVAKPILDAVAGIKWTGREGSTPEFAKHLAGVIICDAVEAAIQNCKGA